jgi:hypothetical protein
MVADQVLASLRRVSPYPQAMSYQGQHGQHNLRVKRNTGGYFDSQLGLHGTPPQ